MAKFKIGQRVRIANPVRDCAPNCLHLQGVETVITSEGFSRQGSFGYATAATDTVPNCLGVQEEFLTPIVNDDKADAFIERLKRLAKEPIDQAPYWDAVARAVREPERT